MILQAQRGGAGQESNCGQLLTKSIVQFLTEPFLLAIADLENLTFKSLAPADLGLQFLIRRVQFCRSCPHPLLQEVSRFFERGSCLLTLRDVVEIEIYVLVLNRRAGYERLRLPSCCRYEFFR